MKNKGIIHAREKARIYRHHYKPTWNLLKVLRSILAVLISGSSLAAGSINRKK